VDKGGGLGGQLRTKKETGGIDGGNAQGPPGFYPGEGLGQQKCRRKKKGGDKRRREVHKGMAGRITQKKPLGDSRKGETANEEVRKRSFGGRGLRGEHRKIGGQLRGKGERGNFYPRSWGKNGGKKKPGGLSKRTEVDSFRKKWGSRPFDQEWRKSRGGNNLCGKGGFKRWGPPRTEV